MMNLISGKDIAKQIENELLQEIEVLKSKNIIPTIAIIQVGDNPASAVYVRNKLKLCERLKINGILEHLEENISEEKLLETISKLNNDEKINGILVQLPLPRHIDENKVIKTINPNKDVDCFHCENVGKI